MRAVTQRIILRACASMLDGQPDASMSAQSRRNALCFHVGCSFDAHDWNSAWPDAREAVPAVQAKVRTELETLGFTW